MRLKPHHLYFRISGRPDDRSLLVLIPWLATLITGFSTIEGLFLRDRFFVIAGIITTTIYLLSYFLLKSGHSARIIAWIMVINTLALISVVWFRFEGSKGAGPVMILMVIFCVCLFFSKAEKVLVISIVIIGLILLLYVEYHSPSLIKPYKSQIIRLVDLFITFTVCGIFIVFVVQVLLKSYALEKYKADQVEKLKTSFLANISHEIRTPLNAILGFSNLIAETRIKAEERLIYSGYIQESCKSLVNMIDEIIEIARIESNQMNTQKVRCNVTDTLKTVYNHFIDFPDRKISKAVNFSISPSTFEKDVYIETDPVLLKQVLINLLDNAIKFTQSGFIEFGFEVQKTELLFYVKDTGIGIPEEESEMIFDNFSKIQQNERKLYRGMGLGLALSKKILDLLAGKIWVNSVVGVGSTFWFTIPSNNIEIVARQPV